MIDYNNKFNFFDDDLLAKEWFNRFCARLSWKFFENQEEMLYMANETESGIPKLKEGALEAMARIFNEEIGFMRYCVILGFIESYRVDSNVDLSEEAIWMLKEEMGEEEYEKWEEEAKRTIVADYAKHLGEEKAKELAKKWWGENNGVC